MMNYFERIRRSIFNEKIRKYKLYSIIFGILSIIGGVLTLCVHISFILIDVIFLGIMFYMVQGLIKYNHLLESSQGDVFYQRISEYGYYDDVIQDISYSMENECLYQKSHVYITKDWIVDFDAKDIGVIQLDQIIWMYGVQLNGIAYVCLLYTSLKMVEKHFKILQLICMEISMQLLFIQELFKEIVLILI